MAKSTVFLFMLAFSLTIFGQTDPKSKAEKFASRTGTLISKEFVELGNLDEIDVRLVKLKDLLSSETEYAIRMEFQPNNEIVASPRIGYIDSDEFDALIKVIRILQTSIINQAYTSQADFTFRCRSNLVVGYFYDLRNKKWVSYIQLDAADSKSTVQVENDGFAYLLRLIEDAKKRK